MRHIITAGFVVTGCVGYSIGFTWGASVFFLTAAAFELITWNRLRNQPDE